MGALIAVDSTLGSFFIGVVLSAMLFGVNLSQVLTYFQKYSGRDTHLLKSFVLGLLILDTANLVLTSHSLWTMDVLNFGDYISNTSIPWSFGASDLVIGILDICIQNFFAHRVYQLGGGSIFVPVAIVVASLGIFGVGTAYSIRIMRHRHFGEIVVQTPLIISALSLQVFCDLVITVSLVHYLLRNRTTIKRTNVAVNLLSFYFINCGLLNLVFTIVCIFFLVKTPKTWIPLPFYLIQVRLYFCSFMAILNSRQHVRGILEGNDGIISMPLTGPLASIKNTISRVRHTANGAYSGAEKGLNVSLPTPSDS
ncbi:hypothetical protein BC834DRAFT_390210 [Gloeopeniophorella convolvens]|nr:hypothetical protein BC834DRAFT_390210 [Gloeopeniophorella convolvens]